MAQYFDRYDLFKSNGTVSTMPVLPMERKSTDKTIIYKKGHLTTRFDNISQKYYNSPYYSFLILGANLQYGNKEFDIPDGTVIVIPFPFNASIQQYQQQLNDYLTYYGN